MDATKDPQSSDRELQAPDVPGTATMDDGTDGADDPNDGTDKSWGISPEAFEEWVAENLRGAPSYAEYPGIMEDAIKAVCAWRLRFRTQREVWCRIMRNDRILKELNECAPVVARVVEAVARLTLEPGQKATILDLCSGFGYMSMLLSEVLPPERVDRIVLLDKAWPLISQAKNEKHQINWDHIYYQDWPILLTTSKRNLKVSSGLRDLDKHLFNGHAKGNPVIMLGIHLCSTLSIRAVEVFNNQPTAAALMLKPCCLPPTRPFVIEEKVWSLGSHSFPAREVCASGSWYNNKWKGQSRGKLAMRFELWAKHLYRGVEPGEGPEGCRKRLEKIIVQEKHFQNAFVFAERCSFMQPAEYLYPAILDNSRREEELAEGVDGLSLADQASSAETGPQEGAESATRGEAD